MNLYIALPIIFKLLLRTQSKELPIGNYGIPQIVPLSYRRLGYGLRPVQRCITCTQNLLLNTFLPRSGQNGAPQIYNIYKQTSTEKTFYRRLYDADEPHIDLQIPAQSRSSKVTDDEPNMDKSPEQIDDLINSSKTIEHVATSDDPDHQISINQNTSIISKTGMKFDLILDDSKPTPFDELYSKVLDEVSITQLAVENTTLTSQVIDHEGISGNQNSTSVSNRTELDSSMSSEEDDSEIILPLNKNRSLANALEKFECKFYGINFVKFSALSPSPHGESGMSFVQSGLFLALALIALSAEVDSDTKKEIDKIFGTAASDLSDLDKINFTSRVIGSLPESMEGLRFRWSSHLVLGQGREVSDQFKAGAAAALQLKIDHFERNQTPAAMAAFLNRMIEEDSGAIRDTFEESDLTDNEEAVLITTLYFRARWRSAPTLLNGTWRFRDAQDAPTRTVRMIRINDVMNYRDIPEWDAEAIEIPYMTQGLTLLMLVPRGNSLKPLVEHVTSANLSSLLHAMKPMRIAARVPLYTLRMTLLLPNKLQAMGISRLVNASAEDSSLRLSQAVQRIMFWAEAGRNAFKDDGLEWDIEPKKEVIVDRPYIFYVRWHNLTIMNGNFAL